MEKIISMTLYGNNSTYTLGSIENAKLIPKIYGPDWKIRFYIRDVSPIVESQLKKLNCEVIDSPYEIKNSRMLRFLAVSKNNIVLVRDCDSIVSYREKMMVNEFLNSKKKLHIIRDHPNHKEYMMAGMFGFNQSGIDMKDLINMSDLKDNPNYMADQIFLAKFIYPLFKNDMFIHDNFNKFYKERDEIVLKYPRKITHIGQRVIRTTALESRTEDELRLSEFKGYIQFKKTSFNTVPELMDYFINCLKVSRILKRKLIITDYCIKTKKIKLSDYILIDELLRYTFIFETNNFLSSNAFTVSSKELEIDEIPLSLIKKMDHIDDYELINIDISINCDLQQDVDEYTLYNVIQLRDELNYKIEEYIVENNIDLSKIAICHDQTIYESFSEESKKEMNIIKCDDLYNFDDKILNEFLRLFSGIYKIHIKPSSIIQKFSLRYWNHLDNEFICF